MFRERFKNTLNWGITIFCVIACSLLFGFFIFRIDQFAAFVKKIMSVLTPVTWGAVITFLLNPMMQRIERAVMLIPAKTEKGEKMRRTGAKTAGILLSEIILLALLVFLIRIVLPQLIDSISMLVTNIGNYANSFEAWLDPLMAEASPAVRETVDRLIAQVRDWVTRFLKDDFLALLGNLTLGVVVVGRTLYSFILGVIVSVYWLASKQRMLAVGKKCVYALFKPLYANRLMETIREANRMFRGFVIGKIADSAIIGVLCFIGMTIMKMPFVILISVIVGVTNLIPYFGPFFGAVPSIFLILMIDPLKSLIFAIFVLFLQQLDGNFIGPKILGDKTGVSAFGVLFSILVGGGLFGFIGMLLAVPTFGLAFQLCRTFIENMLKRRSLPVDTAVYAQLDHVQLMEDGTPMPIENPTLEALPPKKKTKTAAPKPPSFIPRKKKK